MAGKDKQKRIIEYILTLFHAGDVYDASEIDPEIPENVRTANRVCAFLDEIPGGFLIYRADSNENIIYANKALLEIFRCENLDQFIKHTGGTFRGVVHKDDIERVEKEIAEQIFEDNSSFDYVEYRIVRKDGIVRWVEDYGHFIEDKNSGKFFYVFITDATEKITRRIVETATLINDKKDKEQRLQNLIEEYDKERKLIRQEHLQRLEVIEGLSINYDSILYADIDTDTVLPYRLSTRLERQFNKKLEVRNLSWFLKDYVDVWVHPDDRKMVSARTSIDYIKDKLAKENTYYLNYRCIQNGEIQYIQLRIVNVGGDENISQTVFGYRNVDDEVRQEMVQKQLLQTALNKSKLADIAKNTFLSNMSHDMRTPLNAIFGYVRMAKKSLDDRALTDSLMDKIETAGKQILDLVEKVLEISYYESNDQTVTSESDCGINEIIQSVYSAALPSARHKNISITVLPVAVKHNRVVADRERVQKLLSYIIGNAVQYTGNGGSIDISVDEAVGKDREFGAYTFKIKDTGIGIPDEYLTRIFEPFERAVDTTSSGVFGSGLGLTIAKHLAESMNGSIAVESELGKGSTFSVTVKLRINDDDRSSYADEDIELQGKRILIVEDNEINLEIETEILNDLGFITESASDGAIAVKKLQDSPHDRFDLVLMDIQMPVMDGRAAARAIRAENDNRLSEIPIIALSANAFESDRRLSLEAGMDEHLTKPIDVPLLVNTIKSVLSSKRK